MRAWTELQSQIRRWFLLCYRILYWIARRGLFTLEANTGHAMVHDLLARWDGKEKLQRLLRDLGCFLHPSAPVLAGGVSLPQPFILAAGWAKGDGYDNEVQALAAVLKDGNLLPGWRTLPHLAGPMEFGSYTRWPRHGNTGRTMWREPRTLSLGNRVGLRNPGIRAVASYLAMHKRDLPACFGINLALSPGLTEAHQMRTEVSEALVYLFDAGIRPSWLTLNVSCPSHDEDVALTQTEDAVRAILEAAREMAPASLPLWIKVSPDLPASHCHLLLQLCTEYGVQAIVATNARQETGAEGTTHGVSGGNLAQASREALTKLVTLKRIHGYPVDIIACGGILRGRDLAWLAWMQVPAWQYNTALIYRGPLAATLIYREAHPDIA